MRDVAGGYNFVWLFPTHMEYPAMMKWIAAIAATMMTVAFLPAARAADAPTGVEANQVVDYYFSDATTPIVLAVKLCEDIYKDGPEKNNCNGEIDPANVEPGTTAYVWMKLLVPHGASAKILAQVNNKGVTRDTYDRAVPGALRYRTWMRTTFGQAGKWEIRIYDESGDSLTELYSAAVQVGAPMKNESSGSSAQ